VGIAFPQLASDPARQFGFTRPEVLPTTIILSSDGQVIHRLTGPQTFTSLSGALNLESESLGKQDTFPGDPP